MLTKQDYAGYLRQIGDIETRMRNVYAECVTLTSDAEAIRVCTMLVKQEEKHAELVKELVKLFDVF